MIKYADLSEEQREKQRAWARRRYWRNPEQMRENARRWCKENPERKRALEREWQGRVKERVIAHYTGGAMVCQYCGFSDIRGLCIDHINGGGARHRQEVKCAAGSAFYRWLELQGFPEGFQVLCANCNLIKGRCANEQAA